VHILAISRGPGRDGREVSYDYRFLNRENIPDVRQRNLPRITTITREFAGWRFVAITHHLTIIATRAKLRETRSLGPEQ
jgi:broad specificity phosphatase PhoE